VTGAQTELAAPSRGLATSKRLILAVSRLWAWVFLGGLILFFTVGVSITTGGEVNFLSLPNSQNIINNIVSPLLMGLGQTFVIISGGIDLSVGWVMGVASVVSAKVTVAGVGNGTGEAIAIVLGFAAGLAAASVFGLVNGLIIAKLRIPSFIVTLGMGFVARGVALIISGGNVVGGLPEGIRNFGNESLLYIVEGERVDVALFFKPNLTGDAVQQLERVFAWPVVVTTLAALFAIFLLRRTQFGRHTYAIGGNREASVRAGVPADRVTILIFTFSAFMAGMAGVLHTARYTGGSSIAGDPLLLSSIAAVIIGGVSMFGGRGTVTGTVIGALIIAVLTTGLVMLQVQPFWQYVVIGSVVILAVLIDQARDLIIGRAESG
jgi:ribose transport system permease protein